MHEVIIDGASLTCAELESVSLQRARPRLTADARSRLTASAERYAAIGASDLLRSKWSWLVGGDPPADGTDAARLFVLGHCAGVGPDLPADEVRALILARANALATGYSGVRPLIVERLLWMLEEDVLPVVPSVGAVGAAGSIQLAHVARFALGFGGQPMVGDRRPPLLVPTEKEALSLINGASYTNALAALAVSRTGRSWRRGCSTLRPSRWGWTT
jgi:histidine ammonia-lyase